MTNDIASAPCDDHKPPLLAYLFGARIALVEQAVEEAAGQEKS